MRQDQENARYEIQKLIADQKETIIPKIRDAIYHHIAQQDRLTCLTIVSRDEGRVVEEFAPRPPNLRYVKALTAFVRKKDFEGRKLDSILSDGTAIKVAEVFSEEISNFADEISESLIPYLLRSEIFANSLSEVIATAQRNAVPGQVKRQITVALTSSLKAALAQQVDASSIGAIKAGVGKIVGSSITTPIGVKLAAIIARILATSLKPIIIKILSSAALKAMIAAKLKAVIIGAMLGAFVKLLAMKLGLSVTATTAWVLTPLVVAWLAAEAYLFPGKLAKSVSEAVAKDLRSDFEETSRTIADMVIEMAIAQVASHVVSNFANDESISGLIDDLFDEAA